MKKLAILAIFLAILWMSGPFVPFVQEALASPGQTYGPELLTNGAFNVGSDWNGWSEHTNWTWNEGYVWSPDGDWPLVSDANVESGKTYRLVFDVIQYGGLGVWNGLKPHCGGWESNTYYYLTGTYEIDFYSTETTPLSFLPYGFETNALDNVSLKEVLSDDPTYTVSIPVCLGASKTGKTLNAKLIGTDGNQVGGTRTAGIVEISKGNYLYTDPNVPYGFRGLVEVYDANDPNTVAVCSLNPEEIEYADVKASVLASMAGLNVVGNAVNAVGIDANNAAKDANAARISAASADANAQAAKEAAQEAQRRMSK
jgi:hypothetical protein